MLWNGSHIHAQHSLNHSTERYTCKHTQGNYSHPASARPRLHNEAEPHAGRRGRAAEQREEARRPDSENRPLKGNERSAEALIL